MSHKVLAFQNQKLSGKIRVPGDKSISHRAVMFGALAEGKTTITNFLVGEDCLSTIGAFQAMGVSIQRDQHTVWIESAGFEGLNEPVEPINLGNSGTTARLLMGILAGLPHHFTLYGDASLSKRPMDRIADPLREMGAKIDGRNNGRLLPMAVRGGGLSPITFYPAVKSAQVKSGVLLAGLLTDGETIVVEETKTRDHTENMLKAFGADLSVEGNEITVRGNQTLRGCDIEVPGDISSAAFFLVAASIAPDSEITIENVGLNPTRTGIIDVLELMGVSIMVEEKKNIGGEPIGDITVRSSEPKAAVIEGDIIPRIIDEIPIIALLATQAKGQTIIKDAEELRFKETDRIDSVVKTLTKLGASITPTNDGMVIEGGTSLNGGVTESFGDHRIGMMIAIASLLIDDKVELHDDECINISYPTFFEDLHTLLNQGQ
ncbi:3-phosphoshikimate 1-carboxyvinyltransferase [Gracilibacillus caseinilyticus]|uniref:3-phosphoshikimate 1-carboxyvinyltransferase n=1 Tax=Gracilibacillus caseinilyticus TaxID=2932256 RepID=A0ABY4ETI7_9BACI|nr:3-phosphoshikimate 1-carboxyvinyltransferase [Gracilibacillus caseinilyticus]UOQ47584.1 3-phosphoshikimate 1-carboxyvinyltransferase [Gracilibacillus caseinilyticus]